MLYPAMLDLNTPQTRQTALRNRLDTGGVLIAAALAEELGVSVDTVRRDLIALEQEGLVRRVRGGAMPTAPPQPPYIARAEEPDRGIAALADRAVRLITWGATIFLDGGTTMNAVAARLPANFGGLVVTPAPSVALAALRRSARVHLIGGPLCAEGAMATGGAAEAAVRDIAADLCFLGACGLQADFGVSAEDAGEAGVKRAMGLASARTVVVTTAAKLARRGRHRVLGLADIDALVTDATADALAEFVEAGVQVIHV